jgi:hypothetical protein
MNPLLKSLTTPQAAPETRRLARLRRGWIALSLLLAASVLGLGPLTAGLGAKAALVAALLLPLWLLQTALYWRAKLSADNAWAASAAKDNAP